MIILRQHIYSSRPAGYNARGFLTNPVLADDSTLDFTIDSYEQNKKYWKKNKKSIGSLIGTIKTGINAGIAKKEKQRREKMKDSIDSVKENIENWKEKTFARKDYEGLGLIEKYILKKRRSDLANELKEARKRVFEDSDEEVEKRIKEECERIDKNLRETVQRIQDSAIDQETKNKYMIDRAAEAERMRRDTVKHYKNRDIRLSNIYFNEQMRKTGLNKNLNPVKNLVEKHKDKLVKGGLGVAGVGGIVGAVKLSQHNDYVNNNLREI